MSGDKKRDVPLLRPRLFGRAAVASLQAFGAGAANHWPRGDERRPDYLALGAQHCARGGDQLHHTGVSQAVIDDNAVLAVERQARLAQHHQVLRHIRLPSAQHSRQVAHAGLIVGEEFQDVQPRGVRDGFEQVGGRLVGVHR